MPEGIGAEDPSDLMGWTCEACGDTFTMHAGDHVICPSCGSAEVHPAAEPFL